MLSGINGCPELTRSTGRSTRRRACVEMGVKYSTFQQRPPRSRSPAGRRSGPVPHGLTETSRVVAEPSLHCLQSLTVGSSRLERSANPEPGRFPPSACPLQGAGADGAARLTLCVRAACGRARCHHRALASPTPGRAGRVEAPPPSRRSSLPRRPRRAPGPGLLPSYSCGVVPVLSLCEYATNCVGHVVR